ncbi:MAG: hypothetical protein P8I38_08760 [Arenicella sp.]|nr:hypothetical protein [Arenicella sp.]
MGFFGEWSCNFPNQALPYAHEIDSTNMLGMSVVASLVASQCKYGGGTDGDSD